MQLQEYIHQLLFVNPKVVSKLVDFYEPNAFNLLLQKKELCIKMSVAYVLYGVYNDTAMYKHKSMISKLRETYNVSVFLITTKNVHVNIEAKRLEVNETTLMRCLYSGLVQIPSVDYMYITNISKPYWLSPDVRSSICCLRKNVVWLHKDDRPDFMVLVENSTTDLNLKESTLRQVKCSGVTVSVPTGAEGEICVVGNGPLSDSDRDSIDKCHKVLRFNDTKNRQPSDRCDIHVMRKHYTHPSATDNYPASFHDGVSKVILVGDNALSTNILKDFVIERHPYQQDFATYGTATEAFDLFPNCDNTNLGTSLMHKISRHPSLGMITLSLLDALQSVKLLHIYGMNFSFGKSHTPNEEIFLSQCCSKCIVHETHANKYIPVNSLNILCITLLLITLVATLFGVSKFFCKARLRETL